MSGTASIRPAKRIYRPEDLEAIEANGYAYEIGHWLEFSAVAFGEVFDDTALGYTEDDIPAGG